MEKSQLAREVSRGTYKTKLIRPIAISQYTKKTGQSEYRLEQIQKTDSYNSPLYPVFLGAVFKLIGASDFEAFRMKSDDTIYTLDRIIVGLSMLFFLMGIIMVYLLGRAIFDETVAGLSAFILLTCELFWTFTQTGMPNCFMFMIFSAAIYFIYLSTEKSAEEAGSGFILGALGGVLLVILCLAHWMAVWLLLGFLVYSFLYLKPRGAITIVTILVAFLAFAFPVLQNIKQTGNPLGTAFFTVYTGLGASTDLIMRSGDVNEVFISVRDIALKFTRNTLSQVTNVFEYIGFILVAPLFFLSLMHNYRRKAVANFRYAVFYMWIFAALGMSIYGLGDDALYSKQIYYLFAGIMTIYGLSMVMIIWSRFSGARAADGAKSNLHLVLIGLLSAAPLFLTFPDGIFNGLLSKKAQTTWPPYSASALNTRLNPILEKGGYIFSDQPWAVAWYADRNAIWTPHDPKVLKQIEKATSNQNNPVAGIHVSPTSIGEKSFFEGYVNNVQLTPLILDGWIVASVNDFNKLKPGVIARSSPEIDGILDKYSYPVPLNGSLMIFHAAETPKIRR